MKRALLLTLFLLFSIVSSQQPPHIIIGKILCENPGNVNITFINERTGDSITNQSQNGNYSFVLNNFPHGWKDGDVIKVIATKDGVRGEAEIVVNNSTPYQWLNISLSSSPSPPPSPSPPAPPSRNVGIKIVEPQDGSKVGREVFIKGKAWSNGNGSIVKVEIKIDNGTWNVANGTKNWSYVAKLKPGWHSIEARCYDGHEYNSTSINIYVEEEKKSGYELLWALAIIMAILTFIKKVK